MAILDSAETIGPQHVQLLRSAFSQADKQAWCYFAPFLCCFSLLPGREVQILQQEGAICLIVRRGESIDLVIPPVPFSTRSLELVRMEVSKKSDRSPRILWVDESDANKLGTDHWEIKAKDKEYMYSPSRILAAEGKPFKDLRKRLNRFAREEKAQFREIREADISECHSLLRHWRRRQGRKQPFLLDWGYTRAALDRYFEFDRADLRGWCVEVDDTLSGFAMAGPMNANLASFFIAKADPDIRGLSEYLRMQVYQALSDYSFVNDAGDLGLAGLHQSKSKFRPLFQLPVFGAEYSPGGASN